MGTRSTVKFYNEFDQETPIIAVYQQFDGYISGVGHQLAEWLKGKTVINGISGQKMEDGVANGMGCLAAQFVGEFKKEIGGLYIVDRDDEEQYNYQVRYIDGAFEIKVDDIFKGTPEQLLEFTE